MNKIRTAGVQFEHAPGDKEANFKKIRSFVQRAKKDNVQIIVFPECCITGYFFLRHLSREELAGLAEPVFEGPSCRELSKLSQESRITIGAGLVELGEDCKLYNTVIVAMPDGRLKKHRKLHTFVSRFMDSGSEYTVFDTPHGCRVGVLTCYDNNLVENVRITALMGADIILAPHQTGGCRSADPNIMGLVDRSLWDNRRVDPGAIEAEFKGPKGRGWLMRWLPSRAHDNGVFYVFANGVGVDDDEIRTGNAMIIDTYGRILAETWKADDDMVVADLDPALRGNSTGERWITTRRPQLYGPLTVPTGKETETRAVRFDGKGA
ncbi:MAG TPA: nitrilase-related carbon-nitrogen hydrolase [archaeon]|nr:nitrilase-related carbon-nitrogen hydrolase [archaeon]